MQVKVEPDEDSDDEAGLTIKTLSGRNITLNETSEFCRSLGDIPTYGMAGNRREDEEDELMVRL
jgi:U4/U6.U5 tri-snRNP-associated protein 1